MPSHQHTIKIHGGTYSLLSHLQAQEDRPLGTIIRAALLARSRTPVSERPLSGAPAVGPDHGWPERGGTLTRFGCAMCGDDWVSGADDTYRCPTCWAYDGDHHLAWSEALGV